MPVTLTIKQVPDELAAKLRALAARNHRSIQGELMCALEVLLATQSPPERTDLGRSADIQPTTAQAPEIDDLLAELDHIVAGTHWGDAPLLSRLQANDRCLTREVDHLVQERGADYRP